MKGKRFTEEQFIRILQEAETGLAVADVCRKHNCSELSFYRWKAKFGGMDVSEAKRLREFERENAGAEEDRRRSDLGHPHAEGREQPKVVSRAERRRCVTYLRNEYEFSEQRACQAMQMNRSRYRYVGGEEPVDEQYRRVVSLSQQYPYWGYRKIYDLLRGQGISRERVRVIRRREGLQLVRKRCKRRLLGTTTQLVKRACFPNHVWSYDFVFDQTEDARQLKCLTLVDEFTRQGLAIRVGRSLTAGDVIRVLDELFREHGRPACLRSDNVLRAEASLFASVEHPAREVLRSCA